MAEELPTALLLGIPFAAALALSIVLSYWFLRDKTKCKLMFAVGTFIGAWGNFLWMIGSLWDVKIFVFTEWLFVPIAFAVPTAVLSSLLKVKDFERPFRIFLCGTGLALFALFAQLPLESLRGGLMILFMAVSIPTLIFLVFRDRESSDLIFLMATLCFIFQGITREVASVEETPIILSLFGTVFTGLMFAVPNRGGLASFLTLERKLDRANEDLRIAQDKLLKAERLAAIGELAGQLGHDLRNPLQGIASAAYYLRAIKSSMLDDAGREMLETIETCVKNSNKIINDLVEYSTEIHLELEQANPKSLMESTLRQVEIPNNIKIDDQTRSELSLRVDKEKIERVFVNILRNAFDAMPDGGRLTIISEKTGA